MTQPTQDTDITSSISPLFDAAEDFNDVKKLAEGGAPTSIVMESTRVEPEKFQKLEAVKSLGENFPWIVKFSKVIQSAVGSKNPKLLDQLLNVYNENMSKEVNTCYSKPYRAAKLKTHISETLMFFHLYWRNIKEKIDDHNQYLDKMSEILGLYVDMELKASRRGKESASKIAAKLLTAMFIYLDNSEEHVFRILFRVKFITKNYSQICGPIFTKLFDRLSGARECVTGVTYVRYLLAFKLWKRIKDDLHEKKKINELAVTVLGQRTPTLNNELDKIIPKPSDCHKNSTLWLLQPNSFDLKKACDDFIKYEINTRIISLPVSMERLKVDTQINLEPIEEEEVKRVKKVVKLRRFKPSFPKLRSGEVVFIDLTSENDDKKQVDGKKKKKRDKKKLQWLKEVSKRSKLKKENKVTERTWVEKANAHTTDDYGSTTEDKITESTQSPHRLEAGNISDNVVTSQTSLLNNDAMVLVNGKDWIDCIQVENSGVHSSTRRSDIKTIKHESKDVTDDSTTDKNCDKIMITDLSSFNINDGSLPSTSSAKNITQKAFRARDIGSETCVVSTTASLVDFSTEDRINVISGSTNETLGKNKTDINSKSDKEAPKNLFSGFKHKNDAVNSKLQNSLLHALSLNEIIQIGRDDADSQSEEDEDKRCCHKIMNKETDSNSSKKLEDFFKIADIQLCDDITDDNIAKTGCKNKVDEFKNIDILDSILNGDMSMQDIFEEQQNLGINPDTSADVHGFFTELFKQSEVTKSAEKDRETHETAQPDKSLPEGSLGMTGILNSLLDSDLTSIDSPPSDFMYSNVQTVDPRLIRKSPSTERAAFLNDFSALSDQFSQRELSEDNYAAVDSLSKRTKDQLFLDQKDSLNCTDLEELGLNNAKETTFEMPVLEEELIQLPQDPLIDDTITEISSVPCESPTGVKSILPSQNFNNYGFTKLTNFQEFVSFRFKDIIQNSSSSEIDNGEDLQTTTLTDFTPPQSVDAPQSPYTYISSPAPPQAQSQTVPHSPTHSVANSRHNITPPPTVPNSVGQSNLTPPPTPQQNQNHEAANIQSIRIHHLAINSIKDDSSQKKENREILQTRTRKNTRSKSVEDEEKVRLAQIQVALTRLAREEMNGRASGDQSLLKNNILANRDAQRQLKTTKFQRIDLRELSRASQQKPVFINLNGKTKPAVVFERNVPHEGDNKIDEDVNSRINIVYKLTSNVKLTTSKDKPYSKLPKVNFTVQKNEKLVSKPPSTITRFGSNVETASKETQRRCSTRRFKTQAAKSPKEMINTRKTFNVNNTEEPSMKKRKITSKFLPMLENEGIIYSVNQQKAQEKHSNVIRRDFVRADRTKKKVV